jgi:hypothetical protein
MLPTEAFLLLGHNWCQEFLQLEEEEGQVFPLATGRLKGERQFVGVRVLLFLA